MVKRARVVYVGNVQGVGFRYATCHIARDYAVTGFVRNRADGSVELVAEGIEQYVKGFLADVRQRMGRFIGDAEVRWSEAEKDFTTFDIAF